MVNLSYYYEIAKNISPIKTTPKVWNYLKYKISQREAIVKTARYTPQVAQLFVTKRCNLDCSYCQVNKILKDGMVDRKAADATLEKVKVIFDNPLFSNALLVDMLGGEPLLAKELDQIVAYLSRRGHIVNVTTNGIKLRERIVDLKQAGVSRISISCYDTNRKKLEANLAEINQIFPTHTSYVLLRSEIENHPEKVLELVRFVRDAGCLSTRFLLYRPMGFNKNLDEIIDDTNPAYPELQRQIESVLPGFCFWPKAVQTKSIKKLCAQLWQRVGCDSLGDVAVCCGIDENLQGPNSNLYGTDPELIYNHPVLVNMRKKFLNNSSEPPDVCKTCNYLADPGW
ncbi:MAG: radical SAM protein [Magnetococcus sp. DMHC-1]|nr:radical SAM protein [Magnetococcales bacterium]